jgi:hypothetical protein
MPEYMNLTFVAHHGKLLPVASNATRSGQSAKNEQGDAKFEEI